MAEPFRTHIATAHTYGAYGERSGAAGDSRAAYAGQIAESGTGWYLLGERPYSPLLRRFLAPDPLSPFGEGGLNRHAYCNGDPVNHVDPLGSIKRPWLVRKLSTAPTSTPVRTSPRDAPGMSLTPSMGTAAAAPMSNASILSAAIPSGSLAAPSRAGDAVLGQLVPDTGRAPGRRAARRRRRAVDVRHEEDFPPQRWRLDDRGRADLEPNWTQHTHLFNEESTIWAADTFIEVKDFEKFFDTLRGRGVRSLTLYSGVHGTPSGKNWAANSRFNQNLAHFSFLADDVIDTRAMAAARRIHLHAVDMSVMTREAMQESLSEDGVHVIGYCYGIADREVMKAIGLQRVTVYANWINDPRWWTLPPTP